jgi:hypothetical protein
MFFFLRSRLALSHKLLAGKTAAEVKKAGEKDAFIAQLQDEVEEREREKQAFLNASKVRLRYSIVGNFLPPLLSICVSFVESGTHYPQVLIVVCLCLLPRTGKVSILTRRLVRSSTDALAHLDRSSQCPRSSRAPQ